MEKYNDWNELNGGRGDGRLGAQRAAIDSKAEQDVHCFLYLFLQYSI